MAGKWPPPSDYDVNKFTVTETTYGDMCHISSLLQERRRAQIKAWPKCAHTHIPPPPPRMIICPKEPPFGPLTTETISPGPIHTSIDDASRHDLYQHTMDQYDRCQATKPRKPKPSPVRYGRWGSNWSNFTEGRNATGGFNVFINGNPRFKAEDEDRRAMCDCFGRRRMPLYATNRTSRLAMERARQDPLDTYCSMLIDPERTCDLDYTAANFGYDIRSPPEYKYKGFYQHRPFRGTVGIPAYNKAMEGYYALSQHESRLPQPVTL